MESTVFKFHTPPYKIDGKDLDESRWTSLVPVPTHTGRAMYLLIFKVGVGGMMDRGSDTWQACPLPHDRWVQNGRS